MNYNKYEQSLLEAASSLDVLIQSDICFKQNGGCNLNCVKACS